MQELQPPIYLFDFRIGEPMTALTDFLVSAVCFYAFYKLGKTKGGPSKKYFQYYFLFLGLATFWGGFVTHALIYNLSQPWKVPGWIISTWAVSLLAYAMVRYHQSKIASLYKLLIGLIALELITIMSVVIYTVDFKWAGAHSAFGLFLIVGALSVLGTIKYKEEGSRWMLYGVGTFLISGIIFSAKLSPHTWFNHVDLTHVFLAIAAYVIYLAVDKMMTTDQQSKD